MAFFYHWNDFYGLLKKSSSDFLLLSFLLFFSASLMRFYIVPQLHHIFYDEFYYLNVARNIYYHNIFAETLSGSTSFPEVIALPFRPGGYPFFLTLVFRVLGDSERTVFYTNCLLGSCSVLLVFWIGYLLFYNLSVALWGAVVFNFLPMHLRYSGGGGSDISALFFILLAIWSILVYFKIKKDSFLYLPVFLVIFLSYIRPENLIFYILVLIILIVEYKKGDLEKSNVLQFIFWLVLLGLPLMFQIPIMINIEQANSQNAFVSINNLLNNLGPNLKYLFEFSFFPLISTVFFLLGCIVLFGKNRRMWLLLFGWVSFFFIIYSSYFKGKFSPNYSYDSDRHFLVPSIAFSILSGYGIYFIQKISRKIKVQLCRFMVIFVIIFAIILNSSIVISNLMDITLMRDAYKELWFLKKSSDKLPAGLYILCYNPAYIISETGRKAMKLDLIFENRDLPKELILFKGFWWYESGDKSADYEHFLKKFYDFKVIVEEGESCNKKFGFYLLDLK